MKVIGKSAARAAPSNASLQWTQIASRFGPLSSKLGGVLSAATNGKGNKMPLDTEREATTVTDEHQEKRRDRDQSPRKESTPFLTVLKWVNTSLTFLASFGLTMVMYLLALRPFADLVGSDGPLATILGVSGLVLFIVVGVFVAWWQRRMMEGSGYKAHLLLLVVLLACYVLFGPKPMLFTIY